MFDEEGRGQSHMSVLRHSWMSAYCVTQIDTLNADYEKVQKNNLRLQKLLDNMEDEKIFLQSEVDRVNKDSDMR